MAKKEGYKIDGISTYITTFQNTGTVNALVIMSSGLYEYRVEFVDVIAITIERGAIEDHSDMLINPSNDWQQLIHAALIPWPRW